MCWHCREGERFLDGTYKRVPWERERWAGKSGTAYHYVHVSRHDPSLVAYTASEEHGEQDRQTRIAPGRYLTRFYGEELTQKDIQYWCGRFKGEHQEEIALKFASKPDEIAWVYENGPSSCMSGGADRFSAGGHHPASVYGAGDLAVAYIMNEQRVTARAVCWPEKQIYGRVYGDDHTLRTKLDAAGYEFADRSDFNGARLLRIECDNGFVCPYLDIGSARRVQDDGEYLIVGYGGISADTTDGCAGAGPICPRCGEYYDADEGSYVHVAGEYWCPNCVDNDTSACVCCSRLYSDEDMTQVRGGNDVCDPCLDREYEYCEVCEEYHHQDDEVCASEEEEEEDGAPCPTITDDPRQGAFL